MTGNEQFLPKSNKCSRKYMQPKDDAKLNGLMLHYYKLIGNVREDTQEAALAMVKLDRVIGAVMCDGCLRRLQMSLKELDQVADDLIKFHNENEAAVPPPGFENI